MTITHHLDHATLMSYASGTLGEALSTVVMAHLQMCPECRKHAHQLNVLGGVLLDQSAPAELLADPASTKNLIVANGVTETIPTAKDAGNWEIPPTVANRLDVPLKDVAWQWLGPGVSTHRFDLSDGEVGDLRLLRVAPSITLPEHSHGGSEITLILKGAYQDCFGRFGPGDVADFDEDCQHQPVVEQDHECICLVASEAPARFTGLLARLAQPLTGM